jgi:hypothetical protein
MSLDSHPQPTSALPVVAGAPPAHWLFWSYLWRYSLAFVIPCAVLGMYWGLMESSGYLKHTDAETAANVAVDGLVYAGLGQVIALIVALRLFVSSARARRRWAAHREAGWTTAQCRADADSRHSAASTLALNARLHKLGLDPVAPPTPWTTPPPKKPTIMSRLSVVLFLAMVIVGVGVLISPWLDTRDVQSIRCEVVSAEPRTASGGSRGSVSTPYVLVETQDCGPLAIEGMTFDARQEVASSFEIGATYEFDIGWYSRTFFKNGIQTVQEYRLIESE